MQLKSFLVASLAGSAAAQSLTQALGNQTNLSNLTSFLSNPSLAPLVAQLGGLSNITLLAPSNAAFTKLLSSNASAAMLANPGYVAALLQYHVITGAITNVSALSFPHTALNNASYSNVTQGQVVAASPGNPTTFTSGALAISNVSGSAINFSGGVIYAIDSFLTIPLSVSATASAANLTSLVGAVNYANLTGTVNSLRDVTIFAPSNAAFAAIGSLSVNASLVASILTYHVIQGPPVYYSNMLGNTTVRTLGGGNVTITVGSNGAVYVNQARVIVPNVLVAGGVVHVIDSVLNPGNSTAMPNPSATGGSPAFSGATSGTGIPFTTVQPASSTINTASAPGASATRTGGASPMRTGAIGAAALFGGAAVALNW